MAFNIFCKNIIDFTRHGSARSKIFKRKFSDLQDVLLTEKLTERTLLRLSGQSAHDYIQGLITNDMNHLQGCSTSIYAMFLNNKGRVMYDTIIYKTSDECTYLIECDTEADLHLQEHLNRYKVRRKVNVDVVGDEFDIWSISKNNPLQNLNDISDYKNLVNTLKTNLPELMCTIDPRLSNMGLRILVQKNVNLSSEIEKALSVKAKEENFYKLLRYKLGIGEGMKELLFEKCFPMEINGDYMHGISFHKGCYIGQELTARTYHTGTIRKRLMPIALCEPIPNFEHGLLIKPPDSPNKSIGKLFGIEQTSGIAMLRIEEALKIEEMIILNQICKTHRPFWWPLTAPKTRMNIG